MVATGAWSVLANCRSIEPDRLFVPGSEQRTAKSICRDCPVLTTCLAQALDEKLEHGVWGGMTERERRALLRRRPDVACWATFLKSGAATLTAFSA